MFLLMLSTIGLLILIVIAIAGIVTGVVAKDSDVRSAGLAITAVAVVLFLIWGFFSCTTFVNAKNVAVITQFGKPVATKDAGLAWKAPWQGAVKLDGTIQTDEYRGDDGCIYVRIGDGSRSCLTTTIRWRINLDAADQVYADYRSNDPTENLRDAVVSTQFKAAAQAVFAKYNPIAGLEVVDGAATADPTKLSFAPDYDQNAADLTKQMETRLGSDPLVDVISVSVSYLSLAKSTQAKLDDFIAAVGDTRIATQRKATAEQEALANKALEVNVTPETLQSKCLDLVGQAIKEKYQFAAGWSCGDAGALVLPAASK